MSINQQVLLGQVRHEAAGDRCEIQVVVEEREGRLQNEQAGVEVVDIREFVLGLCGWVVVVLHQFWNEY